MNRRGIFLFLLMLCLLPISALAKSGEEKKSDLATAVGACTVLDTEGQAAKLGDTWQSKPVVLVFVRHFG